MAEGGNKLIKVEYEGRKIVVPYTSFDVFIEKCKEKFNIEQNKNVKCMLPGDDAELDSDCFDIFQDNQNIQMKISTYDAYANRRRTISNEDSDSFVSVRSFGSDEYIEEEEDIYWFQWDDDRALQEHLADHGTRNIAALLDDSLESWKRKSVNIAVIGQSGKGKSSLINALRGLTEVDVYAAPVGEKETTKRETPYRHPKYNNIIYWDIPGCGTETSGRHKYLQNINYGLYDYFLVVSSERFLEMDIWLAKELTEKKKRCYFIRSKVDIDMGNRKRRGLLEKGLFDETKAFQDFHVEVKTDMTKALGTSTPLQLFLLSSHFPNMFQFQNLQVQLVLDALVTKRYSLAFGMNGLAQPLLHYKEMALRARQKNIAIQASSCMAESTSGVLRIPSSIPCITDELKFYREQLSLDESGLNSVARSAKVTVQDLIGKVRLDSSIMTDAEIGDCLAVLYKHYFIKTAKRKFGPAIMYFTGQQKIAISAVRKFLEKQLSIYIKDANNLIAYVKTKTEDNTV